MAANFSQLTSALYQMASTRASAQVGARLNMEGLDEFAADLRKLVDLLRNRSHEILQPVAEMIQDRVLQRAERFQAGDVEASGELGPWYDESREAQHAAWAQVLSTLRSKPVPSGPARVGFARRSELDSITLPKMIGRKSSDALTPREEAMHMEDDRIKRTATTNATIMSESPFNVMWQIAEFGTGIYAAPDIRTEGDSKVPGGGGAWWLNPLSMSPTFYGQHGGHFLFPIRQYAEEARSDAAFARVQVEERIFKLLTAPQAKRRKKGS
jgi:hypothetical protein